MQNPNQQKTGPLNINDCATFKRFIGDTASLEKHGFKVRVQVLRLTAKDGEALRAKRPNGYKMLKLVQPFFQLRNARLTTCNETAVQQLTIEKSGQADRNILPAEVIERRGLLMRDNYLSPFGGATRVTITTPQGFEFTGHSFCHIDDIFNRKIANSKAFAQAYNKMIAATDVSIMDPKRLVKELVAQTPAPMPAVVGK